MMDPGSGGSSCSWQDLFQALIKAKTKNIVEEVKLRRVLEMLEVERLHMDKVHFNNIFEQKKSVYRMRLETLLMKLRAEERECEEAEAFEVGLVRGGADVEEASAWDGCLNTEPRCETQPLAGYLLSKPKGPQTRADTRSRGTNRTQGSKQQGRQAHHRGTVTHYQRPSDYIKRDFANVIESILDRGFEQPTQPSAGRYEMKRKPSTYQETVRPTMTRSKTLPDLRQPNRGDPMSSDQPQVTGRTKDVYVSGHWVGDPKAISSVRRARKPPEELVAHHRHKAVGDIRRLLNEMPGFSDCSRSCQRQVRMDKVQAMCNNLPPVFLDTTQLKALKQKAESLDHDDYWVKPSLPIPIIHHPPQEPEPAAAAGSAKSNRKQELREKIRQLEEASKDITNEAIIGMFEKRPRKSLVRAPMDESHESAKSSR